MLTFEKFFNSNLFAENNTQNESAESLIRLQVFNQIKGINANIVAKDQRVEEVELAFAVSLGTVFVFDDALEAIEEEIEEMATKMFDKTRALNKAIEYMEYTWKREDIYKERVTILFDSFEIIHNCETEKYSVTRETLITKTGELTRSLIKYYGIEGIKDENDKPKFDLRKYLIAITFPSQFGGVIDYQYLYIPQEGKYEGIPFILPKALQKDEMDEDSENVYCSIVEVQDDENKRKTEKVELTEQEFMAFSPKTYICMNNSASGFRGLTGLYVLDDPRSEEALNAASHGAYFLFKGQMMNLAGTQKKTVRVNHGSTPSTIVDYIHSYAIFFGDFSEAAMDMRGELKAVKKLEDGMTLVLKHGGQCRPLSAKTYAKVISKNIMKLFVKFFGKGNVEYILQSAMTPEQEEHIKLGLESNGEKGNYAGKLVVVYQGNYKIPEILGDMNAYKNAFDVKERKMPFVLLDMPKANNGKSSMQILDKLLECDYNAAVELITQRLLNQGQKAVDDLVKAEKTPLESTQQNLYIAGAIDKLVPEFRGYDQKLKRTAVQNTLNSIAKSINKMSFGIAESRQGRVFADFGILFGVKILKAHEIFTKDAPSNSTGMIIRHPSSTSREFRRATNVSLKTIKNRVETKKCLSTEEKKAIIEMFETAEPGEMVLAASKQNMDILGGMDYDFDLVLFIYDKEMIKILTSKTAIVDIQKGDPKPTAKDCFSIKTMSKPLFEVVKKTTAGVGPITELYATIAELRRSFLSIPKEKEANRLYMLNKITALIDYAIRKDEKYKDYIESHENNVLTDYNFEEKMPKIPRVDIKRLKNRKGAYQGLEHKILVVDGEEMEHTTITPQDLDRIETSLKTCEITFKNLPTILWDLELIGRYHQEVAIDSAKTSVFVELFLLINRYCGRLISKDYKYRITNNRIIRGYEKEVWNADTERFELNLGKRVMMYDTYSKIRDRVEAILVPQLQDYLDEDQTEKIQQLRDETVFVNTKLDLRSLFQIKNIYSATASWSAKADADAQASKRNVLFYEALYNMTREISKLENRKLAKLAYYLSSNKYNNGKVEELPIDKQSLFMHKVCPKEMLALASSITKTRLYTDDALTYVNPCYVYNGKPVYIEDGKVYDINSEATSGEFIGIARKRITGSFVLNSINGKWYARRDLDTKELTRDYNQNYIAVCAYSTKANPINPEIGTQVGIEKVMRKNNSGRYDWEILVDGKVCHSYISDGIGSHFEGQYIVADVLELESVEFKTKEKMREFVLLLEVDENAEKATYEDIIETNYEEINDESFAAPEDEENAADVPEDEVTEEDAEEVTEKDEEEDFEDDFDYSQFNEMDMDI